MTIEEIKIYLELGIMGIIAITSIVLLFKMLFKKMDKNNNGKIEKEEINEADLKFLKEMLKESITTIANGMFALQGISGKYAYNLMLNELKQNKNTLPNRKVFF